MNNIAHLIRQANRIGSFFEAMPDRSVGMAGIVDHIKKFWEPRMRTALLDFLERQPDGQHQDAVLSPLVLESVTLNQASLKPRTSLA